MGEKAEKLSLKLLVDTRANKLLFAEAGKDFVDFLFHILSLPIGTIIRLVRIKGMAGCLGDLYKSIEALNTDHMQPNVTKDLVLQPAAVHLPALLLKDSSDTNTSARKMYTCSSSSQSFGFASNISGSGCPRYWSDISGSGCPSCGRSMTLELTYVGPNSSNSVNMAASGGFVKGVVTYMVMDNLEVKPMSTISAITLLNKFNVKDVTCLEEKEVQVGFVEGVAILKASLESRAVLTTVFLGI